VDIRFDDHLPPIYSVLLTGPEKKIVIEVLAQQDARHVRGIALTPTQGLARGMAVEDTGGPLKAPVGNAVLSRMFDVFGNTIDREAALSGVEWRSVHQAPPSLARRSTKSEVFETGINVIDVLVPLERGGKAGLFGGGGRRQDRIGHHDGVSIFCGIGERCREGEELYDAMIVAALAPGILTYETAPNGEVSERTRIRAPGAGRNGPRPVARGGGARVSNVGRARAERALCVGENGRQSHSPHGTSSQ
jgi:F-type H+-transporting ATPase subunit beta